MHQLSRALLFAYRKTKNQKLYKGNNAREDRGAFLRSIL